MLEGEIKVYEVSEKKESKFKDEGYYSVTGKLGGITRSWVSDVKLNPGEVVSVKLQCSEFNGKLNLRIVSLG